MRTVYSSNAHGKYVATEQRVKCHSAWIWLEISRIYERDMLLGYPTEAYGRF
jgi:hypothetical protein